MDESIKAVEERGAVKTRGWKENGLSEERVPVGKYREPDSRKTKTGEQEEKASVREKVEEG